MNVEQLQAQLERAKEHEGLERNLTKAKEAHRDKPTDKTHAALHAAKGALRAARSEYRTTTREG
jgi:predicted DsbA family dithiol-disulfide isomerase